MSRDDDDLDSVKVHGRSSVQLLGELLAEARLLRKDLDRRPTDDQITAKRRVTATALVFFVLAITLVHNVQIDHCSAGAEAQAGISYFAKTKPQEFRAKTLRHLLNADVPRSCDIVLPFSAHNQSDWPSSDNLIGMLAYLTLFLGLYLWCRGPVMRARGGG